MDNPNIANPTATPSGTAIYIVTVIDDTGCKATDEVIVTVLPPQIESISPIGANPQKDTVVTITGAYFMENTTVTFGDTLARIISLSEDVIVVVAPNLEDVVQLPQSVDVLVTNPDGQSDKLIRGFSYANAPEITEISPKFGNLEGGTFVTVEGNNFLEGATVFLGNQPVYVISLSEKTIEILTLPLKTEPNVQYEVDVIVQNPDGQSGILSKGFIYLEKPIIESISPKSSKPSGGIEITINGRGFSTTEPPQVTIDDKFAEVIDCSDTEIKVVVPPYDNIDKPSPVDVIVENPDGQSARVVGEFFYTESSRLDNISPPSGTPEGGTVVTISGKWFMTDATVIFGGNAADIIQLSDTEVKVLTPLLMTEQPMAVNVVLINPDNQIDVIVGGFTYTELPRIDNISPNNGTPEGGTIVKISGQWFFEGVTVTFGGKPAEIIQLSAIEIQITTPPLDTSEPKKVDVVVENPYGQSDISDDGFTYIETPFIDKISPEFSAPEGGVLLTITGQWFSDDAKVLFDIVSATVTQSSSTAIEIVVPPLETDEPKKVNVIVENPDGQSDIYVGGFVYTQTPEIEDVHPVSGTLNGGTKVTITGRWFMGDVVVTFGESPAEILKLLSSEEFEVITPTLSVERPTLVDVVVANVYGQKDIREKAFMYIEAPRIDKIFPISGTLEGGTEIIISGKWFIDGSIVKIGQAEASEAIVKSNTEILAITPPGSLGRKDVIVINPYEQVGTLLGGFEYRNAPVIQSVQPVVGPLAGNTHLTINGSGFVEGVTVMIGNKEARPVTYLSDTRLIAITPQSSAGLKDLIVINPDGQRSNSAKFNYVDFPDKIKIYNFPNPFPTGQTTTFRYKNGNGKIIEIKIFNLAGELVQSLSNSGGKNIIWDGRDLEGDKVPPGLYPYVYLLNGKFEQRQLLQIVR